MRKIKRVLPTTAMCRGSFWTAFSRVNETFPRREDALKAFDIVYNESASK